MYYKVYFLALFIALSFGYGACLHAQDKEVVKTGTVAATAPVTVEKGPEDALNRGTPRGSATGFLEACSEFDFEKAAEYLDLRRLPKNAAALGGHELARQLNHVLSRSVWLEDYNVSDHPEGTKGDGLPDYRDELVVIRTSDHEYPIWMQRVPRGDGEKIWKISNKSVALIPQLYDEFSFPPLVERIRKWFPEDASFLGIEAFKWFILVVAGLLSWPVFWLIGWLLSRIFSSPSREIYPLVRKVFAGPFVLICILVLVGLILDDLGAGAYAQMVLDTRTLTIIAFVWAIWAIINLFKKHQQNKMLERGRPGAAKLMQPMTTLVKLLVLIFGLLFWLNNVGVNITTVLAGLGVGGLAVALALQKPIEDMMGALSIFSQAPIRVGDFCKYQDIFGVVEDIGLRTTRVRTLTNTVVSIPNSRLAYAEIENISYRRKIRYWPTLRLRYDTSPEQLVEIRNAILDALREHDRVQEEPIRVRFTDFADDAILLKVHSFIDTTEYTEYLEVSEDLNLQIMKIVRSAGARFALPGRSIYIEGEAEIA